MSDMAKHTDSVPNSLTGISRYRFLMSIPASQKVTRDAAVYNGELPGRDNIYLQRTGIVTAEKILSRALGGQSRCGDY